MKIYPQSITDTCKLFVGTVPKQEKPTLCEDPRKQLFVHVVVRTKDGVCCNGECTDKYHHCEYETQQFLHLSITPNTNLQWRRQLWGTGAYDPLDFQQFHF